MRIVMAAAICLGLAACSQKSDSSGGSATVSTADVSEPAAMQARAPGIAVTAAPGVAFDYHYAFRLPSARIAAAQEQHAQACEKLGVTRCRITGMRYRLIGENDIEAMLSFKLDPAIARGFGKNGIALVEAAQGKLVDAEITGTDAGAAIDRLGTQRARADQELKRIDGELAKPALGAGERAELQRQRAEIVRALAAVADDTASQRDSLATTPMVFDYQSGKAIRGFDASAPITSAVDTAIGSAQFTLALLLGAIAIFGPPAILAVSAWLLWRRFGPRRRKAPMEGTANP